MRIDSYYALMLSPRPARCPLIKNDRDPNLQRTEFERDIYSWKKIPQIRNGLITLLILGVFGCLFLDPSENIGIEKTPYIEKFPPVKNKW